MMKTADMKNLMGSAMFALFALSPASIAMAQVMADAPVAPPIPDEAALVEQESAEASPEEVAARPDESIRAPSIISELGERLALEEFNHRRAMAQRSRVLERERLIAQIQEQKATQARLSRQTEEAARPANVGAMMPAQGGLQTAGAAIPAIPAAPPPAPPASVTPRAIGVIGDTGVFTVEGETFRASIGESVGGFRVTEIEGRRIELVQTNNSANKISLVVR